MRALDLIAFGLSLAALCVAVANGCAPVSPLAVCETHVVLAGRCWCLREFSAEHERLNLRSVHRREDEPVALLDSVEVSTCYPCWEERLACGPPVCLSGRYNAVGRYEPQRQRLLAWQVDCVRQHGPPPPARVVASECVPPSVRHPSGACISGGGFRLDPGR